MTIIFEILSTALENVLSILGIWCVVFVFIVIVGAVVESIKLCYKLDAYSVQAGTFYTIFLLWNKKGRCHKVLWQFSELEELERKG